MCVLVVLRQGRIKQAVGGAGPAWHMTSRGEWRNFKSFGRSVVDSCFSSGNALQQPLTVSRGRSSLVCESLTFASVRRAVGECIMCLRRLVAGPRANLCQIGAEQWLARGLQHWNDRTNSVGLVINS